MAATAASWISDRNDFSCFLSTSHPDASYRFNSIGLSVLENKQKVGFIDGGHLGFQIGTISAMFDLQVIPMLPTKFQVNWTGHEAKNGFARWRPSWISDRNDFSYFYLKVTSMPLTKFQVNWLFVSGEEAKIYFQDF